MFAEVRDILIDIIEGGDPHVAIETSAPKIGKATPLRLYLTYYYPLVADASVIGVGCMFIDVTEQRTAEDALLDSEEERRRILGHLLRAEEGERSRLALELHDDTIQVLCALLLQFDGMIPLAKRAGEGEIVARLETSREVLAAATARARRLTFRLHPNVLEERGLRAAITACAQEIGDEMNGDWKVDVPDGRYACGRLRSSRIASSARRSPTSTSIPTLIGLASRSSRKKISSLVSSKTAANDPASDTRPAVLRTTSESRG